MKASWLGWVLVAAVLSAGAVEGQEDGPAGPAEQKARPQDFSAGFQKFYALGLPNVEGATYVKLDMYGGDMSMHMAGRMHDLDLAGNAWMLEENAETGWGRFVVGGTRISEVYDFAKLNKERTRRAAAEAEGDGGEGRLSRSIRLDDDGKVGGKWKKVDLQKDIDKVLDDLRKKQEESRRHDPYMYSGAYGTLFINAIHYHAQGHTDQANELVGMLFDAAGDRRKVLLQAVGAVAESRYTASVDAFFKDPDWVRFGDELDGLLKIFPAGWQNAPAVERLAGHVRQRAGKAPAAIAGEGLSEEDIALAAALAAATDYDGGRGSGQWGDLWVLATPRASDETDGEELHVVDRIKERGMQAVPLLLALLEDEYLTPIDLRKVTHTYSSYMSSQDGPLSEERILQLYNALRRPAARGDIAATLLKGLPFRGGEERRFDRGSDRALLKEECEEWYAASKDKDRVELARLYLGEGDDGQRSTAMRFLMGKGDESDTAAIESYFLDSERFMMDTGSVRQYAMSRGEKAKAFVDKYEASLRGRMDSGEDRMFTNDRFKEMAEKTIASLREIVDAKPAGELLTAVLAGEKPLDEVSAALRQRLGREKQAAALTMLLDAALQAGDPALARDLVYFAAAVRNLGSRMGMHWGMDDSEESEEEELEAADHAEQWKKLLADTRTVEDRHYSGRTMTVGQATA